MIAARLLAAMAAAVVVGAAPASAQTPTGACPQQLGHIVFFGWARSGLNEVAITTLNAAAADARKCTFSSVVLSGQTAKSDPADNPGLSERRVGIVRDALVARGILPDIITIQLLDEDPAKQTADPQGQRDPLVDPKGVVIMFRR